MRTTDHARAIAGVLALFVFGFHPSASAESTGYELSASGPLDVVAGETLRIAATAYEVDGLATLRTLPQATVRAELYRIVDSRHEPIVARDFVADRDGRVVVELGIPRATLPGSVVLAVRVGRRGGSEPRTFEFGYRVTAPYRFELVSDRHRYEPGETIHAFALLRARSSGAPIADAATTLTITGPDGAVISRTTGATRASGAIFADVALDASARDGNYTIAVQHVVSGHVVSATRVVQIGQRTVERMLVEATVDRPVVAPGATIHGRATVRAASGAPIAGAVVRVTSSVGTRSFESDAEGVVQFAVDAPSYLSGDVQTQVITVRVEHPAYGTRQTSVPIVVARSPFRIEIVSDGRSLVPEVPTRIFVHVVDPLGRPAPAGIEVEVTGAGVEGRRQVGRTDADGFVAIAMRVPTGATSRIEEQGACTGRVGVTFDVQLNGTTPMSTSGCATVAVDAKVAVTAASSVVAPGANVELAIARRPEVAGAMVVVDAIVADRVVASTFVPGNQETGRIALPPEYSGFVVLRARPLGRHEVVPDLTTIGAVAFGVGSSTSVLVRPADAFGLTLDAGTETLEVRSRATVRIRVTAPQTSGFYTMVARDLAQHGGEEDYAIAWLVRFFEAAVTSPTETGHDLLVRAALAAATTEDTASLGVAPLVKPPWDQHAYGSDDPDRGRGELRDALRSRDELLRRRIGQVMMMLEASVSSEIGADDPESRVVTLRGGGFAPDAIARLIDAGSQSVEDVATLGGRPMTLAMLTAADPGFRFDNVAARLSRARLVKLMMALLAFTNPDDATAARALEGVPPNRWLSRLVELGMVEPDDLLDPWGRTFVFRPASGGVPRVVLSDRAPTYELVSPGRDGRVGTADDVRDPFARVLERGTTYAVASGEDEIMKAIAAISPADQTLEAMLGAYATMSLAALDEQRPTSVTASASEAAMSADMPYDAEMDMGMLSGGSGSGRGYGYGAGMASLGQAAPSVARMAAPAAPPPAEPEPRAQGGSTLARVGELVRERFPATLFFLGEGRLEGTESTVTIPVADALTTYRVEAIGWNASGWITRAATEFHVDQQATVDAVVPEFATVGDALRVPVRVENRGTSPIRVKIGIAAEGVAVEGGEVRTLEIAPRSHVEEIVPLRLSSLGEGQLVVRLVRADDDAPLDAVRRPLRVHADARLVRETQRHFLEGPSTLAVEVPSDASERGPGSLRLATGFELFGRLPVSTGAERLDRAWAQALAGLPVDADDRVIAIDTIAEMVRRDGRQPRIASIASEIYRDPTRIARALALAWGGPGFDADLALGALEALGTDLPETNDRGEVSEVQYVFDAARLLALAPIARDATDADLRALVARLRLLVENGAARTSEAPVAAVMQAAALASTRRESSDARANELLRRLERFVVHGGNGTFLEGSDLGAPHARELPTSLLAIAHAASGNRAAAFDALRGLIARPERTMAGGGRLYAAAAAGLLLGRADAGDVAITLDGSAVTLSDDGVVRSAALAGLGRPGRHRLEVRLPAQGAAYLELDVRYGRPWSGVEARRLPLALEVEGPVGARDTRAGLAVLVRNDGPRIVRAPVVEVDLPSGAELDDAARRTLATLTRTEPSIEGRTLRLALHPLAPGARIRLPLPLRWTVGGTIRGLGVTAFDDSPTSSSATARAVLPSRAVELPDHGSEPTEATSEVPVPPPPTPVPLPEPLPILHTLVPGEVTR